MLRPRGSFGCAWAQWRSVEARLTAHALSACLPACLQRPPHPPGAVSVATCGDYGNCDMSCSGSLTISNVWEAMWQCADPVTFAARNNPTDLRR